MRRKEQEVSDRAIRFRGGKEIRRGRGWHPEGGRRSRTGHREQRELEEYLEVRQYAVHVRRVKPIRVKAGGRWKTMQDVSDWYL